MHCLVLILNRSFSYLSIMRLDLPTLLTIIAAAQGLLLALLILQRHRTLFANRYLALLMLSYSAVLIHLVLQDSGLYAAMPFLFLISGLSLASLPLHYLYTQHLLHRSRRFERTELIHFIPFALYEALLIVVIISGSIDLSVPATADAAATPPLLRFYSLSVITLGLGYLSASLRLILRYGGRVKEVVSSVGPLQLSWLRNITLAGIAAVSLFAIEEALLIGGRNLTNFILSSVGFAVYVYGMGYLGLLKSEVLADATVERAMQTVEELESLESADANATVKYERSGLSDEAAERYLASLKRLMEEQRIYRNSGLTLSELSDQLGVSPHNLSEVINKKLGRNFYDLVNGYRLEEVKRDLTDPAKAHLKILSIAFDAGFNSKATFNTFFKEQTGTTPSEFRRTRQQ